MLNYFKVQLKVVTVCTSQTTKGETMSLFTEYSKKLGVPVWVFFVATGVAVLVVLKVLL